MSATGPDLHGRVCLVTGATSGIGRVTAEELAGMGATTLLVARDAERGERARRQIAATTGNQRLHVLLADLAAQAQVRRLAEQVRDRADRLHVLVNNAGLVLYRRRATEDGLEWTFAVNHLAPFLLTNLLLDLLRASAPSRVVTVTYELARRTEGTGVTATCVHPGVVRTSFGSGGPLLYRVLTPLARPFMKGPGQGADTVVWLASSPEVEGVNGRYFTRRRAIRSSKRSYDQDAARRLWEVSERLTGLLDQEKGERQ